ncbi:MAG: MATE family efflux transporter [Spirochaetaceae bacterium]|nr:MATE family efflux transporter [Spirochaetaceae bacterium]
MSDSPSHSNESRFSAILEAPIPGLITRLAIPTVISMLVTSIYNMADTFFVSQLGTSASGAVGIVFSLMAIIQAVGFMLGMGAGSLVSRNLGAGKIEDAHCIASVAFFSALAGGSLIALGGLIFSDTLMSVLGATPTILPYAEAYGHYILLGAPVMCSSFVLNNLLRSQGRAALSMVGLTIGGLLNIILDPIFIFGLKMGITGAAIATLTSQCVSFLLLLLMFLRGKSTAQLRFSLFLPQFGRWFPHILKIGLPSLSRQGLAALSTVALNVQAGVYGDAAVAGMSITGRIFMFVLAIMVGLGQGFQPVAGFCYGARRYDRVKKAYLFILSVGFVILTVMGLVLFIWAPEIVGLFRKDSEVIEVGAAAIRYQSLLMPLVPLVVSGNMLFQSTGHAARATLLSSCRQGLFFFPLVFILPKLFGLAGVEVLQPVADFFTALLSFPFIVAFFKQMTREGEGLSKLKQT